MCRDILNYCVRNTEEAEKISRGLNGPDSSGASGRGQGKGVWGRIEGCKLAKTIRQGEEKKVFVNSNRCLDLNIPPGDEEFAWYFFFLCFFFACDSCVDNAILFHFTQDVPTFQILVRVTPKKPRRSHEVPTAPAALA